jgi:hypothetical protein
VAAVLAAGLGAGAFRRQPEDLVPTMTAAGKQNPPPG